MKEWPLQPDPAYYTSLTGMLSMWNRAKKLRQSGSPSSCHPRECQKLTDEQSTNIFVLHEGTKYVLSIAFRTERNPHCGREQGWVLKESLEEI